MLLSITAGLQNVSFPEAVTLHHSDIVAVTLQYFQ